MDSYWNNIATPFFFIVLAFGTFVLFKVSQTQVIGAAPIANIMKMFSKQMTYATKKPATAAAAPAPAAAAAAATV